ncbi:MAG: hypothetical protein H6819_11540 [Phycisphaerales bacterium]|nr:hypothetical protein [Phycisphaerales bacterium]MCB9856797.1 hypothetical protein [Phycisphaerales bacterium]MCB9862076.1 hypothetical protein [Phycisphaerales bacterium]
MSAIRNLLSYVVPIVAGLLDFPNGLFIRLLGACECGRLPARADSPKRRKRGLTIVLGGIEGPSFFSAQMVRGVLASGYRGAVMRVDWNDGVQFIRSVVNLMSTTHQDRWARRVVDIVTAHQAEHPCAPISIVAQSGGCWIAVRALELVPTSTRISTVVLHAAAISPEYDLRPALAKLSHALISVEAFGDFVILGLGTLLFGTANRRHRPAAGLVGFRNPPDKVVTMRWRPSWLAHGHFGNHTSSASFALVRDFIAPALLTRRTKNAACQD